LQKIFSALRVFILYPVKTFIIFLLIFSVLNIGLPQKDPVRIINLKIAADEEVRANLTWKSDIKKLVRAVSRDFERHFGIQFKIKKCEDWTSDNSNSSTLRRTILKITSLAPQLICMGI